MDDMLFSPFDQALGKETRERLRTQYENYEYYDGKQHENEYGALVKAKDLPRPPGVDYDPTRYATNYFKAIINRKARWQMGGKHGVRVPHKNVDDPLDALEPNYSPSAEQRKADEVAENHERLIYRLWDENKLRARLVQAARDRMIADRVVCKIVFNQRTGKLRWIWRPDTEFIPIFSDDDFEDLIACHFIRQKVVEDKDGAEINAIQKQTFRLVDDECFVEEGVYREDTLELIELITPNASMGLDFIPVVMFPVNDLLAEMDGESEVADLREQNDVLNQMNEDAIDSLKFEMFSITAVINAPEGTAAKMQIAPNAVVEARGSTDGATPDIKKVEGGFRWKDAFKDQYMRVKGAMHEISGLPQIVPQELNFGGLNGEALQILFHDIITDTEEHWLVWGYQMAELHEKSVRYLQARTDADKFAYDKHVVRSITDYTTEMQFVLPLPDNRKELVELLGEEMANQLESQSGAMERLGVENVQAKKQEIANEQAQLFANSDLYDEKGAISFDREEKVALSKVPEEKITENKDGEKVTECYTCGGTGTTRSNVTGGQITCPTCDGDGVVQVRQR